MPSLKVALILETKKYQIAILLNQHLSNNLLAEGAFGLISCRLRQRYFQKSRPISSLDRRIKLLKRRWMGQLRGPKAKGYLPRTLHSKLSHHSFRQSPSLKPWRIRQLRRNSNRSLIQTRKRVPERKAATKVLTSLRRPRKTLIARRAAHSQRNCSQLFSFWLMTRWLWLENTLCQVDKTRLPKGIWRVLVQRSRSDFPNSSRNIDIAETRRSCSAASKPRATFSWSLERSKTPYSLIKNW